VGEEDTIGGEVGDITTELLEDAIRLTHPDRHPAERQEFAHRVTLALIALRPFVFPAPKKPEPVTVKQTSPEGTTKEPLRNLPRLTYPCEACIDEVPYYYCGACRAEWEKRQEKEREAERTKRKKWTEAARKRRLAQRVMSTCPVCNTQFAGKRKDARYCSAACRQAAHRERVTDKTSAHGAAIFSRYGEELTVGQNDSGL
jgi:hypothetical protein